jgi:hypothetical protein
MPRFYPPDAPVPAGMRTADLQLRVLRPEHVERDYDALMSSRKRLLVWSGGSWPAADFTLEQNLGDMHYHEDNYNARRQFTFTVLSPDETRCEGCVYIDSWETLLRGSDTTPETLGAGDDEGIVTYWVRDSALERELDRQLLDGLLAWLRGSDWAFRRVLFRANEAQVRDIQLYEEAGLQRLYTIARPKQPRPVSFYGEARVPEERQG